MQIGKKKIMYKYFIILIAFMMLIISSVQLENTNVLSVLRYIFGGGPLTKPLTIVRFILFVSLIQYINLEYILYMLKNDLYLMPRYERRERMLYRILREILLSNGIFIITIGIATIISSSICGENLLIFSIYELIEILLRGYLTTLILSITQVILLLMVGENNTLLILTGIILCLIFISKINFNFFSIMPVYLSNINLLSNCIFNVLVVMVENLILKKIYIKKGLSDIC